MQKKTHTERDRERVWKILEELEITCVNEITT